MILDRLRSLPRRDEGSTLVETTIVFPLLLILTFGLIEFGHALWEWNAAEKATALGARYLATRGPVLLGVPDCFVATGATAGTSCSEVAGATAWSTTCSTAGGGCDTSVLNAVLAQMRTVAPFITAANLRVDVKGSGMGFVGRGAPVPLITVRTSGLTYQFVAIDKLLRLGPVSMPSFGSTTVGEDQKEGPPA